MTLKIGTISPREGREGGSEGRKRDFPIEGLSALSKGIKGKGIQEIRSATGKHFNSASSSPLCIGRYLLEISTVKPTQ